MAVEQIKSRNKMLKDKKIIIYEAVDVTKPGRQPTYKWRPIHPGGLWAYVRQLSTEELYRSKAEWTQDTMVFGINWRPDIITLSHGIGYKGEFYKIVRVDTYEDYKDTIKLYGTQRLTRLKDDEFLPYEP